MNCPNGFTRASPKAWYVRVGEFGNKAFNDIAAEIKQFRAQLRGIVDKEFFLFRLVQIYA